MSEPLPFVSVIIPVFNDSERLKLCLGAFGEQNYPQDRFEVIVVDNGSQVPPRELSESFSYCRFACEPVPGSYSARNRGLGLARGEVLAFTDSDCIPSPNWLASGQRTLASHPNCGFVGGEIELFAGPGNPTAVELYDMVFGLRQRANVELFQHAATANMFTRRAVMNRCGHFDARVKSGGDLEWGQRVSAMGFHGIYDEEALVRHPARRYWCEISRQVRRHAGGRFDRHMANEPYRYFSRRFWRAIRIRLLPNIASLREARRSLKKMGYGTLAWLRVSCVVLGLQYVAAYEFVRLRFGIASERR